MSVPLELRDTHMGTFARFLDTARADAYLRAGAIVACSSCSDANPEAGTIFHAGDDWLVCHLCRWPYPMLAGQFHDSLCATCRSRGGEPIVVAVVPLH